RAWRRSSPALATSFLVITSIGALYTGQFQGIPIAGQAQQMIWAMVDSAMGKQDPYLMPTAPIETIEIAAEPSPVVVAGLPGAASPLPGTRAVTDTIFEAR